MVSLFLRTAALCVALLPAAAAAQSPEQPTSRSGDDPAGPPGANGPAEMEDLRAEVARQRAELERQMRALQLQQDRLADLERRLTVNDRSPAQRQVEARADTRPAIPPSVPTIPGVAPPAETVGVAPEDFDRAPEVAVLGDQGSVITRAGQLTSEVQLSYARADRNRAIFRGIEVIESVLVGVFDINENRQDVLTGAAMLRYGLTDDLELGVRIPVVSRWDTSILAPIQGSTNDDPARTIDNSADGFGLGDLELSARYQLLDAKQGWPFLIGNLQVVAPTGEGPFAVERDSLGQAQEAATGSGFWGVSPSLTAILPTDPAVLFGTIGYTANFADDVMTEIPPVMVTRVDPGDSIAFSAGIGFSLNQRTSLNLGYAHTWAFGTDTTTRLLQDSGTWSEERTSTSRDLQLGRLLFGVTYRTSNRTSLNWSVELGATDDATDLRTVLRIPFVLLTGQ